ncbi:MAG TPA: hypothetical protein VNN77_15330 [candidate division Zixibacteria bacterium]|nr:hypothetical protein [candidate division Zixibacteria bacterium]
MERQLVDRTDRERLLEAYRALEALAEHPLPVVRFNCRRARNELWQVLFDLDMTDGFSAVAHRARPPARTNRRRPARASGTDRRG